MSALTEDMRHALIHVAGVRLGGGAFMAVYTGGFTIWLEAKRTKKIWKPIANPRKLMGSTVNKLIDQGYVRHKSDGAVLMIEQTDKRP